MDKPSQNYGVSPKYGVTQQASTSRLNPSRWRLVRLGRLVLDLPTQRDERL